MKLIDVSHWQGNIDFAKVKAWGIEGVIIKSGGSDAGFYKDSMFETNYNNAKNAGLHVGSYYFVGSGCTSTNDGVADAERFYEQLKGKNFDLPVYMDVEAPSAGNKTGVTDAIIGFCNTLEKKGYFVGVYASDISGFKDRIDYDRIKDKYTLWVARYGSKPSYATTYGIWQYSSTGRVSGISGNVDMDECYVDFPSIIKNAGLNGYSGGSKPTPQPTPQPAKKSNEEIADEVIAGKWGNGDERKRRLTEAGYDYNAVQAIVNQKVGSKPSYQTYIVKKGDTLSGIAKKFGTTYQKIAKDNGIADPNKIYPGQKLIIK